MFFGCICYDANREYGSARMTRGFISFVLHICKLTVDHVNQVIGVFQKFAAHTNPAQQNPLLHLLRALGNRGAGPGFQKPSFSFGDHRRLCAAAGRPVGAAKKSYPFSLTMTDIYRSSQNTQAL